LAKNHPPKSGATRIRFVLIDAEIADGDLGQITQAIQNAVRLPSGNSVRQSAPTVGAITSGAPESIADEEVDDTVEIEGEVNEAKSPRSRSSRRPSTPKVLELDLTTDPSWEGFASEKAPKNDTERFLTVAAWFKLCRQQDAVTTDHVYTCYRAMKWPTAIEDFNGPLRNLKHSQLMGSPSRGQYSINHLGLARVDALPSK